MESSKAERIVVPALVGVLLVGGWGYGISQFWREPSKEPPIAARMPVRSVSPSGGAGVARGVTATPIAPFVPSDPQWREKFDKVYTLAANEAVKRVSTTIPERETFVRVTIRSTTPPTVGTIIFRFQNNQAMLGSIGATPTRPLGTIVRDITQLNPAISASSPAQVEIPQALQSLGVQGDWIYRPEAPVDQRAAALSAALSAATGKKLMIAQQQVDRDAIVIGGTYEFKALEGSTENTTLQLFADTQDAPGTNSSSGQIPVASLSNILGSLIGQTVTSEIQNPPAGSVTIRIHNSASNIQRLSPGPERDALVDKLLANLTAQTGLQCRKNQTKVPVWKLTEE